VIPLPAPSVPLAALRQPAMLFDVDSRIVAANGAADALAGRSLVGLTPDDAVRIFHQRRPDGTPLGPADLPSVRAMSGGNGDTVEVPLVITAADGRILEIIATASPVMEEGIVMGVLVVWRDVTAQRRAEAALRESEARFRASFELTPLGVALGNLDGTVLESNTVLEEMLGHSKDTLRGMSFSEFTHPDDLALERPLVEQVLAGGTDGYEIEKRYIRSNGGIIWARVIAAVLREGTGAPRSALAIIEDITDRRRAEEMLKESEAKYRNLVELSPDAILIHLDRAIVFANPTAAALVGVGSPDELIGRPILDLVRADARYLVAANIELDLRGKDTPLTTLEVLRDDGATIPVQGRGAAIPFDGRPAVQVVLRDVSAEMRSAEALQRSEAEYRHLVEHAPTGIYEIDYAGPRFRRVNDAMCRILGYTREELMAMNPEDLLDEESRERLRERLRRIAAGEDVDASVAFRIVKRDGQAIRAALTVRPTRAADGRMDGALVVAHDITERMRNEEALREARDYLNSLIDYANAPIIVWDPAFRITRFNAAFENLSGYAADEVLGQDLAILFPGESREETLEKIRRTLTEQWESVEIPILRPDGGVRIALWNSATIFDREGTAPLATIAQGQDITDRKRAEAALREYAENLQRSNEDLERFAYVASHDLQEPLRSIVSFSQLLERRYRGQLGQDADEYIEFIVEGGNRMQTLILDLLAYSRVNTTAHELRPTDVEAVIAAVERHLDGQLRKAGAALTYDPLPTVLADPLQLEQIFVNLVTNAVKFHRQGEPLRIHVGARRLNGFWEFSVADNGIGIEPEYYDRIFVIFQRLHTKDAYPGTGIGLAIVKRIVERHGGTVRVDSTPGEGSTFFFTLPAA
jgi:PAS domain S-box-containing protein